MHNIKFFCFITLLCSFPVISAESPKCFEIAETQYEINQCSDIGYKEVEAELKKVITQINILYKDKTKFLLHLKASQKNWKQQRELDLKLRYPNDDKPMYYGSIFPTCYANYKSRLTIKRIVFLKEWLKGHADGEICTGSVMHEFSLRSH